MNDVHSGVGRGEHLHGDPGNGMNEAKELTSDEFRAVADAVTGGDPEPAVAVAGR